jgi:aminocarboxymuconate-semialdehyde decarboxylase
MTDSSGLTSGKGISRRQVLKTGLGTVAAAAAGQTAFARAEPTRKSNSKVEAIDLHAHYFPQAYLDFIADEGKRFDASYRMTDLGFVIKAPPGNTPPLPTKFIDLKQRIGDMDQQGVRVHALSLTSPMVYWGDENFSAKLTRTWNDAASAAHQEYPDRLFGFMSLPMLYPDRALDELNRASQLPGIRGVYMGTNIDGHDLDDPRFEPIFSRIEVLDLPVFLHPLKTVGGDRMSPFYLANLLGNPIDTAIAACHLIFGGVLDRHPKLRIGLPHAGGVLPILIGRIDHGWRVRPELKHLPAAPSTYLQRFTYDTIAHSKPIMEFVIKTVGAERIVMGSDYCFDMGYERPVQFLDQIDISSTERKMILGGNARELLKL